MKKLLAVLLAVAFLFGGLAVAASAVDTYTVTYDANGGTGAPAADTQDVGEYVIVSDTEPAREGYTFKGWTDLATGKDYEAGDLYAENADGTLTAVWEAIPSYTVTYDANGGTGAPAPDTKYVGEYVVVSATEPTYAGYTFKGWTDLATGKDYEAGGLYAENADGTLTAVWEAIPAATTYTVTYSGNAAGVTNVPAAETKNVGDYVVISAAEPVREGYTFKGWTDPATGKAYKAGDLYAENVSTTLNAVWETNSTNNNTPGRDCRHGWLFINPIFVIWFTVRFVTWLLFGWLWMPMPAWGVWR